MIIKAGTGKLRSRLFLILALVCVMPALAAPASAQEAVLELDPAQTQVEFTLRSTLHTVHGAFKLKQGLLRFDTAAGKASGIVVVDAASGESGNKARDHKMHKDILESLKYPEITFKPTSVQGSLPPSGISQVELHGILSLHGSEHEVVWTASVQLAGNQLTASTHFAIPYVNWGLKNPSNFLLHVSDRVDIDIHATGRLESPTSH